MEAINDLDGHLPPTTAAVKAATSVKATATMETAETGAAAEGVAPRYTTMVESTKRPGMRTCLRPSWSCNPMVGASEGMCSRGSRPSCEAVGWKRCSAVVEIVPVGKGGAVRYVGAVIVDDVPMSPIKSPVMPAPAKASNKSQTKTHSETDSRAGHIESGVPKPTWPYD